jgi:hypothetical protein
VNENANPQNYQGDGDGGNKHQTDEDTEKMFPLMETTEMLMKMMEVVKKSEWKMVKRKKSKTFCCQYDSTFTNSPNLGQSYKKTSKKPSVQDVIKMKQIQTEEEEEVHL